MLYKFVMTVSSNGMQGMTTADTSAGGHVHAICAVVKNGGHAVHAFSGAVVGSLPAGLQDNYWCGKLNSSPGLICKSRRLGQGSDQACLCNIITCLRPAMRHCFHLCCLLLIQVRY